MLHRNTFQKNLILETVRILYHATAHDVYQRVKHHHPSISKGTIYRNLRFLSETGQIACIHMPDGADYYDHTLTPHYHFKCSDCNCLFDAPIAYKDNNIVQTQMLDFKIKGHSLFFYGLCPQCNKKKENKQ